MIRTLHIGTNYAGTSSELAGCVNDARDWRAFYSSRKASVDYLVGRKATRRGIERAAKTWRDSLRPGDTGVITFSGHGTRVRDESSDERTGYDQAIVCDDFELIFDDEIAGWIARRKRGSFVFAFLDCCHAATMHRGGGVSRTIPSSRCATRVNPAGGHSLRAITNGIMFAGCGDGPTDYSYDGEFGSRPNGAATYYAIKSIKELPASVSYRRWFNRLSSYLPNENYPQVPAMQGSQKSASRRAF